MTTFLAIAANSKLEFSAFEAPASGRVVRGEDRRYRFQEVVVSPRLTLIREADRERAGRILQKVHGLCLVSNSLSTEVLMRSSIEVAG
jgi:organic hydroperoxide reductase OsmC/OhrA